VTRSLVLASTVHHDAHDTGRHPERAQRIPAALGGLTAAGLDDAVVWAEPRHATVEELARVHDRSYLEVLEAFCQSGGGSLDPDTRASPGSWSTALLAAGAGLAAVDAVAGGDHDVAFVAARPPGHHAVSDRAMGFCLLNNVAVAAAALVARGERVAVIDWDVHHGNGTQDIFWDDPHVLYVSTHQSGLYPGTGAANETGGPSAPGLTVNIPLPAGATGDVVLRALDDVVAPAVEAFAPTWVLVSAGYDAHRADPLAALELSAGDYADLAGRVKQFTPRPLVVFLEGGYDLEALGLSVGATFGALMETGFRPERSTSGGPGDTAVAAARHARQGVGST
jgi:acetoin utilization deacetylase AcuC-like enzyme